MENNMRVSEFNRNTAQSVINMLNGNRASYGGSSSIKYCGHRPVNDPLRDVENLLSVMRWLNPSAKYGFRRRGRGPRKVHENHSREYQCHLPLDKSTHCAVYIVQKP